jgi:GDP/UDP-N,N'-diacetylbacillosamine 2-epimerase (hydrolysing)
MIVLGDRYEILAAVIAARMCGIPVAHISGGDVTEGAIDDSIRHSITKMSQLHFPGCEQSRTRIIQMGEQPFNVFNVGEPGVENALHMALLSRADLAKSISFDGILQPFAIVTFHPVTNENNTGAEQVHELIKAMNDVNELNYVITMANADAGGREINEIWIKEGKRHQNWLVVPSLGVKKYLSAMKYSAVVVGNSSSGIVEAPAMKVPTVNIGDRQKGRMMAKSVLCCEPKSDEIYLTIKKALSPEYVDIAKMCESPFGDGNTSSLIEKHIMEYLCSANKQMKKEFYDVSFDK